MKRPAQTKGDDGSVPSRAELEVQVTELIAQQAAISEVLRAIANGATRINSLRSGPQRGSLKQWADDSVPASSLVGSVVPQKEGDSR
jgi:hypothetical protein